MSKVVVLPLSEIKQLKIGGITDPLEFPLALDKLLGEEIAFKAKWQPLWDSFSVVYVFEDKVMIRKLKESREDDNIHLFDRPPTPLIQ
ncbi:hypothetical protein RYX36_024712, partial [Vicia faba]